MSEERQKRGIDVTVAQDPDFGRRALTKQLVGVIGLTGLAACDAGGAVVARETRGLQGSASSVWFDTYTELRAVKGGTTTSSTNVAVGRAANIGGVFVWSTDTTSADNKGTIIVPTGTRTGCWKRVFEGTLDVKWFGATGDGTTDDSTAIRDALAAVPSTGGTVFFPAGKYRVSQSPGNTWCLKIPVNNVTVMGAGLDVSTIQLAGSQATSANVLFADTLLKTTIQDISIDGNRTGQTNVQHGIALNACADTNIGRVAVRNTSGSNINCSGTVLRTIINDSRFAAAGASNPSIGLQGFTEFTVSGCHFSGITASNAHIKQTSQQGGTAASITSCTFLGDSTSYGIWFLGAGLASPAVTIAIGNNIFSGLYWGVVIGAAVQGLAISGNVVESCAIAFARASYSIANGYTGNSNISITGNMVRNANATNGTDCVIAVSNVTGCTIASNVIACTAGRNAISITHAQNFSISGNSIAITSTGSGPAGIQVARALDGVVSSNVISMPAVATGNGIVVSDDPTYLTARVLFADNSILGAVGTGINVGITAPSGQLGFGENFIPAATTQVSGMTDALAAYPQVGRFAVAGMKRTYAAAKPTTGTWNTGDVVINTAPNAIPNDPGNYSGWVCTAGGMPGTWNAYGKVQ